MRNLRWSGWLVAGILLLHTAAPGLAAPASSNLLEGRLLHDGDGTFYLFHGGYKFAVQLVDIGDQVIGAIPVASTDQWLSLFTGAALDQPGGAPQRLPAGQYVPAAPDQPVPFPGYS